MTAKAASTFRVHEAHFVTSAQYASKMPPATAPEIAFVGRSNVGKSSLLNTLVERKGLVKVSRTPGRTRLINLFAVDLSRIEGEASARKQVVLVDLPGYGYADAPKTERRKFVPMMRAYVEEREGLVAVCQLFDARHAPSKEDQETFFAIADVAPAHVLVATKADKLAPAKRKPALKTIAAPFGISSTQLTLFSSETRLGRDALWERLWSELP